MTAAILITRPEKEAQKTAQDLIAKGYAPLIASVTTIKPMPFTLPDASNFQAIIATSTNAIDLFTVKATQDHKILPTYCVGHTTQQSAKQSGFTSTFSANGNAQDLIDLIRSKHNPADTRPYLYLRALQTATPLEMELKKYNIDALGSILYKTQPAPQLDDQTLQALRQNALQAVLFYSTSAAQSFAALIKQHGLEDKLKTIQAINISENVASTVQDLPWQHSHIADAPNQDALYAKIDALFASTQAEKPQTPQKSETNTDNTTYPTDNAEDIIERFGGIRPMATKIDAAVTTVQGWKKRGSIPPHRMDKIIEAAQKHKIDLSDILGIPAPKPEAPEPQTRSAETQRSESQTQQNQSPQIQSATLQNNPKQIESETSKEISQEAPLPPEDKPLELNAAPLTANPPNAKAEKNQNNFDTTTHDNLIYSITQAERRAVKKSTLHSLILIAISTVALALIFGLQSGGKSEAQRKAELAALQEEMAEIKAEMRAKDGDQNSASFLDNFSKDAVEEKVAVLQNSAEEFQENAALLASEAKAISQDIIDGKSEDILKQITRLEQSLDSLGDFPLMASVTQRFAGFTSTSGGQTLLEQSSDELSAALSNAKNNGNEALSQQIDSARQSSAALQQSLEGVPQNDLKAAAMLLAMTQVRSALNRNGEPFNDDLALLKKLAGKDNPELQTAISKLAPHANEGVLTPTGLSNELKSLTGEIVVASLKGEELNVKDRAKARMKSVLLLDQGNGKVTPSTQTQDTLLEADEMLQNGDLAGAIQTMQTLKGPAAKVAKPWISEAQASLMARKLKATLSGVLDAKAAGLKSYGSTNYSTGGKKQPIYLAPN